ncbi:hypothetical protein AB3R30_13880 [Leptolyngbyaceae cyanobacterium UHCC 1019]
MKLTRNILGFTVGTFSQVRLNQGIVPNRDRPMFLDLNHNDLLTLEQQRIERFRSTSLDSLSLCFLHLNPKNTLAIHCAEPWMVDQLLYDIEKICWEAWVLVGATHLSIYYAQEEIYTATTQKLDEPKPLRSHSSLAH